MKKLFYALGAMLLAAMLAFPLTACGNKKKVNVINIELTAEDYAFAIQKGNSELLSVVNAYLSESKENGSLEKLINSYFDGTATFSYTNKTSQAANGDFIVATNAFFPPFESYNDNAAFVGIDIEIAYNIAQKLGKTLFVHDMEFDSIIGSVTQGKAAIGMAGITVNDTRKLQVDFADGYYTSAQVITVKADDKTFEDCKTKEDVEAILSAKNSSYSIGTQKGTTGYMYSHGDADFEYDGFPVDTKAYDTGALAMQDLANGKINAVILDKQPSLMIAKKMNK
ncbi:MAG: transporter substrate-binding domain-containing protein [Clostridiales bacterium]|nr:transporter substrate-binding domain-containing protein [Clostridiales bacterium]